jgi:hypothetical protein
MKVQVDGLQVAARAEWVRDLPERGVHVADTEGYTLEIAIDSPNSPEEVMALVQAAQRGCFVEHSLAAPSRISHRLRLNGGDPVDADAPVT